MRVKRVEEHGNSVFFYDILHHVIHDRDGDGDANCVTERLPAAVYIADILITTRTTDE